MNTSEHASAGTDRAATARQTWLGYAAIGAVVMIWSAFNIISRIGGRSDLTGFDIAALRFGVSALFLFPLFLRRPAAIAWSRLLPVAGFGGIGYSLLVYSGFTLAPAAHAGVLVNGGIPFATALMAWGLLGFRPNRAMLIAFSLTGLGIGLIGYQSMTAPLAQASRQWLGDLLFFCAALCWGVFGVLLRKWRLRPLDAMAGIATCSALIYLPIYLLWLPARLAGAPLEQILLQGVYQGIVVAILGGMLFTYATQTIGPIRASLVLALVPGVTALAAVPVLGESINPATLFGLLCVTAGALLGAIASAPRGPPAASLR